MTLVLWKYRTCCNCGVNLLLKSFLIRAPGPWTGWGPSVALSAFRSTVFFHKIAREMVKSQYVLIESSLHFFLPRRILCDLVKYVITL